MNEVSLGNVLVAAELGRAPVVPESAGYVALAVADQLLRAPLSVDTGSVALSTDGVVVVEGARAATAREAEASVRALLASLLAVSKGSTPALGAAARRPSGAGIAALVDELEGALIPVNRSAAKRALARLARETSRARESGALRGRRPRRANECVPEGVAPEAAPTRRASELPVRRAATPTPAPAWIAGAPDVDEDEPPTPLVDVLAAPRAPIAPAAPYADGAPRWSDDGASANGSGTASYADVAPRRSDDGASAIERDASPYVDVEASWAAVAPVEDAPPDEQPLDPAELEISRPIYFDGDEATSIDEVDGATNRLPRGTFEHTLPLRFGEPPSELAPLSAQPVVVVPGPASVPVDAPSEPSVAAHEVGARKMDARGDDVLGIDEGDPSARPRDVKVGREDVAVFEAAVVHDDAAVDEGASARQALPAVGLSELPPEEARAREVFATREPRSVDELLPGFDSSSALSEHEVRSVLKRSVGLEPTAVPPKVAEGIEEAVLSAPSLDAIEEAAPSEPSPDAVEDGERAARRDGDEPLPEVRLNAPRNPRAGLGVMAVLLLLALGSAVFVWVKFPWFFTGHRG